MQQLQLQVEEFRANAAEITSRVEALIELQKNSPQDVLHNRLRKIDLFDHGYVEILDCMPRYVQPGRTIEDAIVESARVSYAQGIKTEDLDAKLIKYLMYNRHTSPFEQVSFRFRIKVPKFISIQLLRHRTAKLNEESQRYHKVDNEFFRLGTIEERWRKQCKGNAQSSSQDLIQDTAGSDKIKELVTATDALLDNVFENYNKLIEAGMARELARYCLPMATYTTLIYKMDLHNLLHFLELRDESHAQQEIQEVARAMYTLIRPLVPVTIACFDDRRHGFHLSQSEIVAFREGRELATDSVSLKNDFKLKRECLGADTMVREITGFDVVVDTVRREASDVVPSQKSEKTDTV